MTRKNQMTYTIQSKDDLKQNSTPRSFVCRLFFLSIHSDASSNPLPKAFCSLLRRGALTSTSTVTTGARRPRYNNNPSSSRSVYRPRDRPSIVGVRRRRRSSAHWTAVGRRDERRAAADRSSRNRSVGLLPHLVTPTADCRRIFRTRRAVALASDDDDSLRPLCVYRHVFLRPDVCRRGGIYAGKNDNARARTIIVVTLRNTVVTATGLRSTRGGRLGVAARNARSGTDS